MQPNGRKEIRDAVIIAALVALAQGVVNWGIELSKAKVAEIKAKKRKAEDDHEEK